MQRKESGIREVRAGGSLRTKAEGITFQHGCEGLE